MPVSHSSRTRAAAALWSIALLASAPPAAAQDAEKQATAKPDDKEPKPASADSSSTPASGMPQFVIPKASSDGKPAVSLPQRLSYQYAYGSQSDVVYRRNADLDSRVRDDSLVINPQLNGYVTYRPADWLETTVEAMIEREIPAQEEAAVLLPSGETEFAVPRRLSLIIDQAHVVFKAPADRFRFTVGRRNYEDDRHWLFDTSLDVASVAAKLGALRMEAAVGREALVDLDLLGAGEAAAHQYTAKRRKDLINTWLLVADYRGIEDVKLAAYTVFRDDRAHVEGRPVLVGLSSTGMRSRSLGYWAGVALMRGSDESARPLSGYAFDAGVTYRFPGVPIHPNATLAYAFGSGDATPGEGINHEFRQTGLQSNEMRFDGLAKFKLYGEAVDPELTNLQILTVGLGARPMANLSVDLVYHRYRLNRVGTDLRNSALTALMNQVSGMPRKDVGSELDVIIGARSLFGLRRLGVDLRTGWFFPGDAFLQKSSGPERGPRVADNGFATRLRFWW